MSLASVMGSGVISVAWLRGLMDDAFAQEVEAGAAVHLSFDRFDAVDVAFGGSGAVGQSQAGGDGVDVLADPGGEGVQFGLAGVGFDALKPAGSYVAPPRKSRAALR